MTTKLTQETVDKVTEARERLAKKAAAERTRLNRDRARMLDNITTCVRQAAQSIAKGDVAKHDKWLEATHAALTSYAQFARLTVEAPTADESTPDNAGN